MTIAFVITALVLILNELAKKISSTTIITICIIAYLGISLYAYIMKTQLAFWILAIAVGMFQDPIQALSRSYFGKIIPAEKSGEYFGLYDIFGKGASILGTIIVSLVSQLTGNLNLSVSALSILFLIGLFLFRKAVRLNQKIPSAVKQQTSEMQKKSLPKTARAFYQCLISHFPRTKRIPWKMTNNIMNKIKHAMKNSAGNAKIIGSVSGSNIQSEFLNNIS